MLNTLFIRESLERMGVTTPTIHVWRAPRIRLHRNAKTTPLMRQLIVDRVTGQHWTQARAAEAAGVSVRTVAKWVARWRAGDRACIDAVSRPHRQPRRVAGATVSHIVQLRQTRATAWQISTALRVPRSTVTRVLRQAGLNRLRVLEPRPVIRRYEWPHAGDLLHVDIKPLGRIRGIGHCMTGDRQRSQPGSGWEYIHVAIDDATRLAYVEVQRSQRHNECARFLRRALQWLACRGIRVHRVLTDNGSGYRSRIWAAACRGWGGAAQAHEALHAPHQRQGRALHSNAPARVGLSLALAHIRHPHGCAHQLSALLQPTASPLHASLGWRSPWTRFQEAT